MENKKNKGVSVSIGGNVSDSQVIASSGNINITSNQTNNSQNLIHQEFKVVYQKIEERDPVSHVDKSEVVSIVQNIEAEVSGEHEVNPTKLERWLRFLGEMAPDILDVVIKTLTNPLLGISETAHKIAARASKQ
jgi:hypothetical protein